MDAYLPMFIAAAIGAAGASLVKVPTAVWAWWTAKAEHEREQQQLLLAMKRELFSNGGTSMKDEIGESLKTSKQALALGEQGVSLASEVNNKVDAHLNWHLGESNR